MSCPWLCKFLGFHLLRVPLKEEKSTLPCTKSLFVWREKWREMVVFYYLVRKKIVEKMREKMYVEEGVRSKLLCPP